MAEETLNIQDLRTNARALAEEAFFRYRMADELTKSDLDINAIKGLIARYDRAEPICYDIPADELIRLAAQTFGVSVRDIKSYRSKSRLVKARWFVARILNLQGWTWQRIGDLFGRDHATFIHGRDRLNEIIDTQDPVYYPLWADFSSLVHRYRYEISFTNETEV